MEKVALENKPFMDIASSDSMGFAPYIVNVNPKIPCLVTDVDGFVIKLLRSCADEHLKEYNINFAAFDNCEMPIKDGSFDCITSKYGISSSHGKQADEPQAGANFYQNSKGTERAIAEVYRVLKPGGRVIAVEPNIEFDFDLQKLYRDYNERGRLFGVYTYDEIQAVCEVLAEKPWRDKFISAGFRVETEKKYFRRYSINEVKKFLYKHDISK